MPENEKPHAPVYDPRQKLLQITEALRRPAGDDARFATIDSIAANRDDFVEEVHTTWKHIHVAAIAEIINIEMLLARPDARAMPTDFSSWLRHIRRIWRRVNDAIAWVMIAHPHQIRRLCAHRPRPTLVESNPAAVAALMDEINDEPMSMAIWNDATTCLDVGDLTVRRNRAELEFIELKEGKVNEAILTLHDAIRNYRQAGDMESATKALDKFFAAYGEKGFKQAMRVTKQVIRDMKVMDLVNKDRGPDPDLDVNVEIVESSVTSQSYDHELTACFRRAEAEGTATALIDGCLWIYVSHDPQATRRNVLADFSRRVFEASPETKAWLKERLDKDLLHPVGTLDQWSFVPIAVPIFLRPLDSSDVVDVVYGKLAGRVLLFFDWLHFEDVARATGCALTWVKPRHLEGRSVDLRVGRRTPRFGRSDGRGIRLGGLILTEMFGSGIRPSSVAAQYAEMLERFTPNQMA